MRENPAFKKAIQGQIVLRDFDAPINVGENYVQRLTSYLQVDVKGMQTCKSSVILHSFSHEKVQYP